MTAPKRFKKAYAVGGDLDPQGKAALSNSIGAGATIVGGIADAVSPPNKYGRQSGLATGLKQGATFAAAGATIGGPIGAVAGGVIGLGVGLLGSMGKKAHEDALDREQVYNANENSLAMGQAAIASDPTRVYGNRRAQAFQNGGQQDPASDNLKSEWNNFVGFAKDRKMSGSLSLDNRNQNTGRKLIDAYRTANPTTTLKYDSIPRVQQSLEQYRKGMWNQVQSGKIQSDAKSYDSFMPNLSPIDGWLGSKTSQATFPSMFLNGKNLGLASTNKVKSSTFAFGGQTDAGTTSVDLPGGSLKQLSSTSSEVQGNSHKQGGVTLPSGNEVEGGESISSGFVFSKKLGFADMHKPIAKAIGKIEDKPVNPVRRKTLEILKGREQGLALSQEFLKQNLGIPSDID